MQQVGNRSNVGGAALADFQSFAGRLSRALRESRAGNYDGVQMHPQGRQALPGAVMQLASDSPALFVLQPHQSLREQTQRILGLPMLGDVAEGHQVAAGSNMSAARKS